MIDIDGDHRRIQGDDSRRIRREAGAIEGARQRIMQGETAKNCLRPFARHRDEAEIEDGEQDLVRQQRNEGYGIGNLAVVRQDDQREQIGWDVSEERQSGDAAPSHDVAAPAAHENRADRQHDDRQTQDAAHLRGRLVQQKGGAEISEAGQQDQGNRPGATLWQAVEPVHTGEDQGRGSAEQRVQDRDRNRMIAHHSEADHDRRVESGASRPVEQERLSGPVTPQRQIDRHESNAYQRAT